MISFLTSPKSFRGKVGTNQIRAIRSWLEIAPDVEVIVYGEAEGADAVCAELGITYVPDIRSDQTGLPFFNAIANHARELAGYDVQVYLNSDIMLTPSIAGAVQQVPWSEYLMVGQRMDLQACSHVDTTQKDWFSSLVDEASRDQVALHAPTGKDYFVFSRGVWQALPEITIGRGGYDTALLASCLRRGIPVIDATHSLVALHQYHDYSHVRGGKDEIMHGVAARKNIESSRVHHSAPTIADASWELRNERINRNHCRGDWLRYWEIHLRFGKGHERLGLAVRSVWRTLTYLQLHRPRQLSRSDVLKSWETLAT